MPTNMKLSELVKLKENLDLYVKDDKVIEAITNLSGVLKKLNTETLDSNFIEYFDKSISQCVQAQNLISKITQDLPQVFTSINEKIGYQSSKYFAANYQMDLILDEEGERRTRDKAFSDEAREILSTRLRIYSDWHYPALEIGPGRGVWTDELIGNDPLYLVDIRQSYLDETLNKYNETYQRRLRPYLLDPFSSPDLSSLPQNQFGFVASINVFEYFAFDTIRQYLEEVWKVLRPGGVFLFSYNNGERHASAQLAENGTVSYIPKTMLVAFCETHGYEVITTYDLDSTVSWIEIRKPGELKTVKSHQALGQIIFIPS